MSKLSYTVKEAVAETGLGEWQIRQAIRKGTLRVKRSGKKGSGPDKGEPAGKILILHSALTEFLEGLADG